MVTPREYAYEYTPVRRGALTEHRVRPRSRQRTTGLRDLRSFWSPQTPADRPVQAEPQDHPYQPRQTLGDDLRDGQPRASPTSVSATVSVSGDGNANTYLHGNGNGYELDTRPSGGVPLSILLVLEAFFEVMFAFTCVFGLGASIAIGIAVWLAPAERLAPALEWFRADWHMDHIAAADWAPAWLPFTRWQDVLEDHWIAASAAARSGVAQLKAHPVQASIAAAQYVYVRAAALAARVANAVAAALPDVLRVPSAKYFAIALGIALLLSVRWRVEHQSLTPYPGLGVQLETTRTLRIAGRTVFWRTTERFVPRSEIKSVVVHEALRTWNVVYYLGIVRDSDVVVAFEDVRPRLDVLVSVYHHVQDQLFPTPTRSQTVTC